LNLDFTLELNILRVGPHLLRECLGPIRK